MRLILQDGPDIYLLLPGVLEHREQIQRLRHIHLLAQDYGIISRKHRHIRLSPQPKGL